MSDPLPQGAVIGILGGGQLGRMLSVAAARLGYRCHIFEPGTAPPAGDVAHAVTTAPYEDEAALRAFAEAVDVVTYEFENVPTSALDLIESLRPIRPDRRARYGPGTDLSSPPARRSPGRPPRPRRPSGA